jgi:succinate-semialdehyde dehydrogenase
MNDTQYIAILAGKAREAQKKFDAQFDQERVDAIVRDIAKVVFTGAEKWARMAVDETGMGGYEYKVKKKKGKARILWHSLRDQKSMGIISRDENTGIVEIAKPVGVVGAVQPCTNPIVTPMANIMSALKGKNAIILAPHPRAVNCTTEATEEWRSVLTGHGAPEDLVQIVEDSTVERTKELMKAVDVIVATGGPGMVKAAYSSGKPSYGVGPGNVQCILDRGIDLSQAVEKIIIGRTFDNGIICSGEQSIIMPSEMYTDVIAELKRQNTYVVEDPTGRDKLVKALFPEGKMNKDLIGQPVDASARAAGIDLPEGTVMIAVKEDKSDKISPLRREKMFPVIALYTYDSFDEALEIMQENLEVEGKGHTVGIHSHDRDKIEKVGLHATVSRVVVNATVSTTAGGSFTNGLAPTSTLGCGSWGNNSISENFTYKHLLNITRIAYLLADAPVPLDEELFGDAMS